MGKGEEEKEGHHRTVVCCSCLVMLDLFCLVAVPGILQLSEPCLDFAPSGGVSVLLR